MTTEIAAYWRNYIGGEWVDGAEGRRIAVENPATGEQLAEVARGEPADIDASVAAARACVASRALVDMRPADRGRLVVEAAACCASVRTKSPA